MELNTSTSQQTILLVEDSEEDYQTILWAMKKLAAPQTIYRCDDGDEALDFLNRRGKYLARPELPQPALILLDLNLPGTDGREVLEQIKQDPKFRKLPVVVLTSSSNPTDIERSYQDGANSYMRKPLNLEGFVDSLKALLTYWFGAVERIAERPQSGVTPLFTEPEPDLAELNSRISSYFARSETRAQVLAYIKALLSEAGRKNCWELASQAGDLNPAKMQRLLSHAQWNSADVLKELRLYLAEKLGHHRAQIVLDEICFQKKGDKSAGVVRQYNYRSGRVENCQLGVFLNYVSPLGAALLDCELYLPQEWTNNPNRRRQALIPDEIQFTPKPQLAQAMLDRSLEMGLPFAWVTGSADYGNDACLRGWLAEKGLPFLFEVSPEIFHLPEHLDSQLAQTGLDGLITNLAKTDWKQLPYEENFAARLPAYEWSMVPIETSYEKPGWQNWLLVRRNPAQPLELKYFLVFGAAATTLRELVRIESQRWLRETAWQTLRSKIGLDQYEVRSWQGWYRHITLALVAYAYQVTKPIKI